MTPTITCKTCGNKLSIDEALLDEIKEETLKEIEHTHKNELKLLEDKLRHDSEITLKHQLDQARTRVGEEVTKRFEDQMNNAKTDVLETKQANQELREQLKELMTQLREITKAKDEVELNMQKKMMEEEARFRMEAMQTAEEKYLLKNAELNKQLDDTKKALAEANRKAEQGSQQNQGEVLELELENRLRECFPFDEISEVKKGQRGADLLQMVNNRSLQTCGLILWETKNGKWQPAWVPKFKQDIRIANASIGVMVSTQLPVDYGVMRQIEPRLWVVNPSIAHILADALRGTIIEVDSANKMNENKDEKLEVLWQFLQGPEFSHRIQSIVEHYSMLQKEMEKEKRATQLRWTRQEKSIRAVIDNTIGMYGDLQGITNRGLPTIKMLELEAGEDDENPIENPL